MMKELTPIDLKEIVENTNAEGKGRRVLWQDSESLYDHETDDHRRDAKNHPKRRYRAIVLPVVSYRHRS